LVRFSALRGSLLYFGARKLCAGILDCSVRPSVLSMRYVVKPMTRSSRKDEVALPIMAFASASEWEEWLDAHGQQSKGIWLKLAKKDSGIPSVTRQQAIDAALCFGWIDGQVGKFDDRYWLVRFTPRGPKSLWSEVNRGRAQELVAEGKMRTAGLKEIERAKVDGRWNAAYPPQSKAVVPEDLQLALERNAAAGRFFLTLNSINRYAILHRLHNASEATRRRKIDKFVDMLARGEVIHPPSKKQAAKGLKSKKQ
jgi:uncharacterized protein YdeI (YjbR/CyaY-like superfamily)